jgi:hypothetical protein
VIALKAMEFCNKLDSIKKLFSDFSEMLKTHTIRGKLKKTATPDIL